ncbi:MAG: zinc metallopeptidase [Verrucomicrobiales bacterium]|nr:zinc metallopeptidase [Verrucomicrobiales bacterium]
MTPLYILLIVGTLGLGLFASWRVRSAFSRYSKIPAASGLTGAQVARRILQAHGIHDVEIVATEGQLTDHYDPLHKRLALSEPVYGSSSIAAQGVAAHECGHALQHAVAYAPLQWRMAAVGITRIASFVPFLVLSIGMFIAPMLSLKVAAIAFGIIMLFNLVTLPVEFDASRRAKEILLRMGMVRAGDESAGVNHVLNNAALTYVAAFISSLATFLYYLMPLLTGRSDEG